MGLKHEVPFIALATRLHDLVPVQDFIIPAASPGKRSTLTRLIQHAEKAFTASNVTAVRRFAPRLGRSLPAVATG